MSVEQITKESLWLERANNSRFIVNAAIGRCANLLSEFEEDEAAVEVHAQNANMAAVHRWFMRQEGQHPTTALGKVRREFRRFIDVDLMHRSEGFGEFVLTAESDLSQVIVPSGDADFPDRFREALAGNTLNVHYPYGNFRHLSQDLAPLVEYTAEYMADDYPNIVMVSHRPMMQIVQRVLGDAAEFQTIEVKDAYWRTGIQASYRAGLAAKDPDRVREFCDIPDAPMVAAIIPTRDALKVAERLSAPVRRSEDTAG